jgi:hypothetical protein
MVKKIPMSQEGRANLARRRRRLAWVSAVTISGALAVAIGLWAWLLATA